MKFYQRLAFYLFGVLIGSILLVTIFNKRGQDFDYMPNARTLKNIRSKNRIFTAEAQRQIDAGLIDTAGISQVLQHGEVDFEHSKKPVDSGKLYIVEGRNRKGETIFVEVINCDSTAVIRRVRK